jgi:D-alanine-D-alanine ligase-like ATP-grasp enzyme
VKQPDLVKQLEQIAAEIGIEFVIEPTWQRAALLRLPNGQSRYLRMTVFDLNGAGATEIAKDKDWSAFFLAQHGYPVPVGRAFLSDRFAEKIGVDRGSDRAYEYARLLGWPVLVKPNSKSQGHGISRAHTRRELNTAIRAATSSGDKVYLVQSVYTGNDFRIVLLDGRLISAYQRIPLCVIGDGRSNVDELLHAKQERFIAEGRDTTINISDKRIDATLKQHKLSRQSVLAVGREVALLPIANLSAGGDALDCTAEVHLEWRRLCAQVAVDVNLRYVGIDIMTPSTLSEPPDDYVVIEVNAAPGIDNYASSGQTQDALVKRLYTEVLRALVVDNDQGNAAAE